MTKTHGEISGSPPPADGRPLVLSDRDIASLHVPMDEVIAAVDAVLRRPAAQSRSGIKSTVTGEHGSFFQALPSVLVPEGVAFVKWVTVLGTHHTGPSIRAQMMLTSVVDGDLLAVMDASWITAVRTAAMSALASRALAPREVVAVGFVGCGVQARAHVDALHCVHPGMRQVTAFSRTTASVAAFGDYVRDKGMAFRIAPTPADAIVGQDVVVTSVPEASAGPAFLDARTLKPGAFVSMVDRGRSWLPASLAAFERFATDDIAQSTQLAQDSKLAWPGPFADDLRALVGMAPSEQAQGHAPRAFIFAGMAVCDAAVAWLCHQRVQQ